MGLEGEGGLEKVIFYKEFKSKKIYIYKFFFFLGGGGGGEMGGLE